MIKIHLIEDNQAYRQNLLTKLNTLENIKVVADHSSIEEALAAIKESLVENSPDLFLLDIWLHGTNGLDGMRTLHRIRPQARFMILSAFHDKHSVKEAFRAGAAGYLLKTNDVTVIKSAIEGVIDGRVYLDPGISNTVVEAMQEEWEASQDFGLASQEIAVVRLLAEGLTKKEIAEEMALSVHTVDGYLRKIYRKMAVHTVNGAVAKAFRSRIV